MNWSQLTYEGTDKHGRHWLAWESMCHSIQLVLAKNNYRSPVPEGKLTCCLQATAKCLEMQYVFQVAGQRGDFCRAPSNWECAWKSPSQVPALSSQRNKYVEKGDPKSVTQYKTQQIHDWVERNLQAIDSHAARVQLGLDEPVTLDELKALGEEMVRRLHEQQPYAKA